MSTTTVVKKDGQAAIAADTLTKWESLKESSKFVLSHHKIVSIGDSYLAVTGASSAKLALRDYFASREGDVHLDSVENIYRTWVTMHHVLKEDYYLRPYERDDDDYESTRMDVLIANPYGIFGVSAHRSVQEFSKFYAHGRGNEIALGAMFALFDDPRMSAKEIAELGVAAAAEFDDSTGLPITSYVIPLLSQ